MENSLYNRMCELAERAYMEGRFVFSDFLSESECAQLREWADDFAYANLRLFGGMEDAARNIARFGDGREDKQPYPISLVKISPKNKKFADALSHRDFLGALLSLGIERSLLGDIVVREKVGYVFCLNHIADFICENLSSVSHTVVTCEKTEEKISPYTKVREECFPVSSLRADVILCALYRFSRAEVLPCFENGFVCLNGKICTENAKELKEGDVLSVRGKGKFTLTLIGGKSKKGKIYVTLSIPE